jgi:hypothetical protein
MSPDPRQRPPVTLEALLQLKRSERPAPEFWDKFDRELRQKQLAALVEERRWWQKFSLAMPRWAYAPAGAAAALALSVVSVRMMMPVAEAPAVVDSLRAVVAEATPAPAAVASNLLSTAPADAAVDPARAAPAESVAASMTAEIPAETVESGAIERALVGTAEALTERPSARTIAASLAQLEVTDPDLVRSMQSVRLSDARPARVQQDAQPVATLASLSTGNSRISRLAVADIAYNRQFTPTPAGPEVLRERMARRLGDTDLGGSSGRLGLAGDRLHLRF